MYTIQSIECGILTNKHINEKSVVDVSVGKLSVLDEGLYDSRMGVIENGVRCKTCSQNVRLCPGHFGKIALAECVYNPIFITKLCSTLNCICIYCFKIKTTPDHIILNIGVSYDLKTLFKYLGKIDVCVHCNSNQPVYKVQGDSIHMVNTKIDKTELLPDRFVYSVFMNVNRQDLLDINIKYNPLDMIWRDFPVIPLCTRPYVMAGGNISDDDLTAQLCEIVKINNHLNGEKGQNEEERIKLIQNLRFRISTYTDNSRAKAKHATNDRPYKGIKERLTGKDGIIRGNTMAKRCEQSARTVIGPDAMLSIREVGVPRYIANNLTYPELVTRLNITKCIEWVLHNKTDWIVSVIPDPIQQFKHTRRHTSLIQLVILQNGDVIKRGGGQHVLVTRENMLQTRLHKNDIILRGEESIVIEWNMYNLILGDIVFRHLMDGDFVVLNRQPSLHKLSMMGQIVRVLDGKTLRMNLAITKPFNADFDGDEMNIHVPQNPESVAELSELTTFGSNLISSQYGKPTIAIVQDSLLALFILSHESTVVSREHILDVLMYTSFDLATFDRRIGYIEKIYKRTKSQNKLYSGRTLLSLLFPADLYYKHHSVDIIHGVIIKGRLTKKVLHGTYSLIQLIYNIYGENIITEWVDNIHFVTNQWLLKSGYSINIMDCIPKNRQIPDMIERTFEELEKEKTKITSKAYWSRHMYMAIENLKNNILIHTQSFLSNQCDNNFHSPIISGSKGDFFNITQILGVVGQQHLAGDYIKPMIDNGSRVTVHMPKVHKTIKSKTESEGFITNSFITGLTPTQFYLHAMSGREGISDTAMGTSVSGYSQRKICKLMEDLIVAYDSTVREHTQEIYQFVYGLNGYDPSKLIYINGHYTVCDVGLVVRKIMRDHLG